MRSPPADERERACDEARLDPANAVARTDEAHHHAHHEPEAAASAPQCITDLELVYQCWEPSTAKYAIACR
jgi:hypothetical protein